MSSQMRPLLPVCTVHNPSLASYIFQQAIEHRGTRSSRTVIGPVLTPVCDSGAHTLNNILSQKQVLLLHAMTDDTARASCRHNTRKVLASGGPLPAPESSARSFRKQAYN